MGWITLRYDREFSLILDRIIALIVFGQQDPQYLVQVASYSFWAGEVWGGWEVWGVWGEKEA